MMSDDVKNLELFIDSFVTSNRVTPPIQQWNNSYSYDQPSFTSNNQNFSNPTAYNGDLTMVHQRPQSSNGTEIWGERKSGNEWRSTVHKPSLENSDFRPEVQSRPSQWKEPVSQDPMSTLMPAENMPHFSEMSAVSQNPNDIQSLVFDLIRQNNMNKPNPYNLPAWVDITKPPPPFPNCAPTPNLQLNSQMQQPVSNHREFIPSMNFNQSFPGMQQSNAECIVNLSAGSMLQESQQQPFNDMSSIHGAMQGNRHVYSESGPPLSNRPGLQSTSPLSQDARHSPHSYNQFNPSASLRSVSLDESFTKSSMQMHSTMEESSNQFKSHMNMPNLANTHTSRETSATPCTLVKTQSIESNADGSTQSTNSTNPDHEFINCRNADSNFRTNSARSRSENSENSVTDQPRRNSTNVNHPNQKRTFHRQPSAADLDMNWRNRDNAKDQFQPQNCGDNSRSSSFDSSARRPSLKSHSYRGSGDDNVFRSSEKDNHLVEYSNQPKARGTNKISDVESAGAHHVTAKSKNKLLSWLQQNNENSTEDCVGKELRHLQISDSEIDLNKFIEATQSFATNEAKMREVAEILCNKALGDARFSRNVALLCDRLSFMMVHGTKFRNVVLNVMQGHYKNRDLIFTASFRGNERWFGFVTFLVEIFLNMRTSSRERLLVLTTPVLNCLFQVLHDEKITQRHIDCFGQLFEKVGPALELESVIRLDKLMGEIRDRCVTSKTPFIKRVLLHCVELYASKWETVPY